MQILGRKTKFWSTLNASFYLSLSPIVTKLTSLDRQFRRLSSINSARLHDSEEAGESEFFKKSPVSVHD